MEPAHCYLDTDAVYMQCMYVIVYLLPFASIPCPTPAPPPCAAPSFARALPPKHSFTNVQSLGKSAVVQCYARGSPPPDMKWEKEGEM